MKLGTKIVPGFVLANVIFMRPVQNGSTSLSENLPPLLDQATEIQFNSVMGNFQMRP